MILINKEYNVIEPYKYYAEPGEMIVIEDNRTLHLDSDSTTLFETNFGIGPHDSFEDAFKRLVGCINLTTPNATASLLAKTPKAPIIIGGCGRSGTTLLQSILGAHPRIQCFAEELYCFYPDFRLNRLVKKIESTNRWVEKTPKNVRRFEQIHELFQGNVKLIHLVRDGRSVVTSKHPNGSGYWVPIERWIDDTSTGWNCKHALQIKYENLVQQPEETLRYICKYIQEPFDEKLLEYEKHTPLQNNIAWFAGARKIHTGSLGRWKEPEHSERIAEFTSNEEAMSLLRKVGYKL